MSKIVLKAQDLDGYLTEADKASLARMDAQYRQAMVSFNILSTAGSAAERRKEEKQLIAHYNEMGALMQEICQGEEGIQVYSFVTPAESHGEASRLIAKLRDVRTGNQEFVYYIQRAYELLFNLAFGAPLAATGAASSGQKADKNHLIVKTPVTVPVQNYAVHKIPNVDAAIENTVM